MVALRYEQARACALDQAAHGPDQSQKDSPSTKLYGIPPSVAAIILAIS